MKCTDFERMAVFYACEELEPAERAAVEEHAAACASCAASLERERRLVEAVVTRASLEPSTVLLAQCRGELSDALDDAAPAGRGQRIAAWFSPRGWFTVRPAWTAAFCVVLGIALGISLPRMLQTPQPPPEPRVANLPVTPTATLTNDDLRNMRVADITPIFAGGANQAGVEVHVTSEQPFVVRGTVNNQDVRRVLTYVVENGQRFDSGLRLDSLEVLRARTDDAQVRQALCYAARNDNNPGVRLKALEALRGREKEDAVRKAFLDALLRDANPGVRIEAINVLRALTEDAGAPPDAQLVRALRDRMQNDPNSYVRLQSAAAVRQLGPRAQY